MGHELKVGDQAPDVPVLDAGGGEVRLSRYWRDAPAILGFLRHFG